MSRQPSGVSDVSRPFLYDASGAELAAWVPHRPARPQKSEGGRRFRLVSP
jgi:excinuclease ABC subunit B